MENEGKAGFGMTEALSIALSGLTAQKQRLAATASNIANAATSGTVPNASTAGSIPNADPSAPASTLYRPLQVSLTTVQAGENGYGVRADVTADAEGYTIAYSPSSSFADGEGYIAVPNVDLTTEAVTLLDIKNAYKANLAVMKTQDEMAGQLMDIIS